MTDNSPPEAPRDDEPDSSPGAEVLGTGETVNERPPKVKKKRRTLLPKSFMEGLARRYPDLLEDVRLEDLRPDIFPFDRILAELIIARDRLRGILHPELKGKLTARW